MRSYLLLLVFGFSACTFGESSLKIKGSDTEVNLVSQLAERYYHSNPGSFVSISGGGSGLGIASLMNGQTDIANSSRELNELEKTLLTQRNVALDTFVFAEDAIAFVVSSNLPLDSISTEDLGKVFSGQLANWEPLCGLNRKITLYGRQSNSGTYDFVMHKLAIRFSDRAKEMNGNAQILEAIKADPSGIGYVGAGYVTNMPKGPAQNIKVLFVSGPAEKAFSPLDSNAVFEHRYYFRRHLYQYIRRDAVKRAQPFIAFEKSEEGAQMIRAAGYYPVKKF